MITLEEVLQSSLTRPLIGLDLETTGTNPDKARICEVGLEIYAPGHPVREYRTLVNPLCPIPAGATAKHKITDEMVKDAPTWAQLARNIASGLSGVDYAGYNVRFDLRILTAEFRRVVVPWTYEDAAVVDGFRLWQVVDPRSLEDAIRVWLNGEQVPVEGVEPGRDAAHCALWDVKHSTRVIAAQISQRDLPRDVQALHKLCSPGWIDAEGKFQWRDGQARIMFGKHRGEAMQDVPSGYFRYMLRQDFEPQVKRICEQALAGIYPEPPADMTTEEE